MQERLTRLEQILSTLTASGKDATEVTNPKLKSIAQAMLISYIAPLSGCLR